MTRTLLNKTIGILAVILLAVTASSCSDDDYYDSPLVGNWELYSVNGIPVYESEVSEFSFYSDGTGTFGQYGPDGLWNQYYIQWSTSYGPGSSYQLNVYTSTDTWQYTYRVTYDTLTLYDLLTGNTLLYTAY